MIQVGMKGIIDRIERKDGHVRIVDYKTGKDEKSFVDVASLFDSELNNRNKAVLQTFLYGMLYANSPIYQNDLPIQASLFNIRDLFRSDFSPLIQAGKGNSKSDVTDIRIFFDEFQIELKKLLRKNNMSHPDIYMALISEMNKKFGHKKVFDEMSPEKLKEALQFRQTQIQEEVYELGEAILENDAEEIIDAFIDLLVYSFSTLDFLLNGSDVQECFKNVMYANLSKVPGKNPKRENPLNLPDLIKPEGWKAPDNTFYSNKLQNRIGEKQK